MQLPTLLYLSLCSSLCVEWYLVSQNYICHMYLISSTIKFSLQQILVMPNCVSRMCHSVTVGNKCLHPRGPKPCNLSCFNVLESSNNTQYELTNQNWEWWPNVWMSTLLNARYYYTPAPVVILLFTNLLGYRGPTIVKPVPCLESG